MALINNEQLLRLFDQPKKILLINAPAVDTRLPWSHWHQPVGLLKIGAFLKSGGHSVKIIDCLSTSGTANLPKEKIREIQIDGYTISLWRLGLAPKKVIFYLREWEKVGWGPDFILISCGFTAWWEGAEELISSLTKYASATPIILGGAYPTFYSSHALLHSKADYIFTGNVLEASNYVPDLSIYQADMMPRFAAIHLTYNDQSDHNFVHLRNVDEITAEILGKAQQGVKEFAFYDEWLDPSCRDTFLATLKKLSSLQLNLISFVALGNISPRSIDKELAKALKAVNFRHIYLHDDLIHSPEDISYLSTLDDYAECASNLKFAGFKLNTDQVGAAVLLGLPAEDLGFLINRIVKLSSMIGSVHLVPFQFTPDANSNDRYSKWLSRKTNEEIDPAMMNGRLFPLVRVNGSPLEDYLEVTRLLALLNAKFRSQTYDFLAKNLTASLFRKSLRDRLWDPFSSSSEDVIHLEVNSK